MRVCPAGGSTSPSRMRSVEATAVGSCIRFIVWSRRL
jgi:hypothetical protein